MRVKPWISRAVFGPEGEAAGGGEEIKEPAGGVPEGAPESAPSIDRSTENIDDAGSGGETLLGEGDDDERKVVVNAEWPEKWREQFAGEDEKLAKRLERFQTPADIVKAWRAAEQKISSGEYKKTIDENATDEEKAEARKEAGVPETPDGYEISALDDLGLERDDPALQGFLAHMHEGEATQDQIDSTLKAYGKLAEELRHNQTEGDKSYRMDNEDTLRAEWGDEYRPRINLFKRVLEDKEGPLGSDVAQALMTARDADGNRVINNSKVAMWLNDLGQKYYGDGALITGEQAKATQSRRDQIKAVMNSDFNKYSTEVGENGKTMQQEYTEMLESDQGRR